MSVICFCGICVPYSVIWPLVIMLLKLVWDFFQKVVGKKEPDVPKPLITKTNNSGDGPKRLEGSYYLTSSSEEWDRVKSLDVAILRFTATWCKPCKAIEPVFDELSNTYSNINFVSIDVDQFDTIAAEFGAITIPLFVCVKSGASVAKFTGKDEEKLRLFVESSLEK